MVLVNQTILKFFEQNVASLNVLSYLLTQLMLLMHIEDFIGEPFPELSCITAQLVYLVVEFLIQVIDLNEVIPFNFLTAFLLQVLLFISRVLF